MALRPIMAMPFPGIAKPDLGERPSLEWVAPTDLMVDETYQRNLSRRSIALITKMVSGFAWNRMKPPIVVRIGGEMHVIDGQHTAVATATLGIESIPVFVVRAEEMGERARAFVGHNSDRITVSPLDIYRALVASADESALECEAVLKRAGVQLRIINQSTAIAEGDTMAVGTIRALIERRGPMQARRILTVLVKAKKAPISAHEIKAVEYLMCTYAMAVDPEALSIIIRADGDSGMISAHATVRVRKISLWKVLVERWSKFLNDPASLQNTA